ncbi:MAG: protein kinase family protein [Bacillaceae bacterium]
MMTPMKLVDNLSPGTVVSGKWSKQHYKVIRKLGGGAIGTVYLVEGQRQLQALKISEDTMSITSEVTVLKCFSKVQGSFLGPFLFDVDDWEYNGETYYFYIMEYIEGDSLLSSVLKKGYDWGVVYVIQMLKDLEELHNQGWIFGDIKPDNILISKQDNRIRFLDVGGATLQGRAVKEYTEFFDRGYWELGGRKAEPSYDTFAIGMVLVNMAYPSTFLKGSNPKRTLLDAVEKSPFLKKYEKVIKKTLFEGYTSCKEMREALVFIMTETPTMTSSVSKQPIKKKKRKSSYKRDFIEITLLLIGVISGYIWYIYYFL